MTPPPSLTDTSCEPAAAPVGAGSFDDSFIGLCFGPAGVGKTLSARRYARWNTVEELLLDWGPRQDSDAAVYAALARSRTAFYTPTTASPWTSPTSPTPKPSPPSDASPAATSGSSIGLWLCDEF